MMPTDKGFCISAEGYRRDQLVFMRSHSGPAPEPQKPLRPLWPLMAGSFGVLLIGVLFILHAPNAGVAIGGLAMFFMGMIGLILFIYYLGREYDADV